MCVGDRRRVAVPPRLGYGTRGSRAFGVPPDAALEYIVELGSLERADMELYDGCADVFARGGNDPQSLGAYEAAVLGEICSLREPRPAPAPTTNPL